MSDNILDNLLSLDDNRDQAIKTNVITGNRFILHSLPKEFQDWHNVYFIMEKESNIDTKSVSEAILNGYMWKAIFDGAEYGIAAFFAVMWTAVKVKLTYGSPFSFMLSFLVFLSIFTYIAYHNVFYAMIRAQIIGEVTKKSAIATAGHYASSFWGVFFSLVVAFCFTLYTLYTFLPLFAYLIYKYDASFNTGDDTIFVWFEKFLIVLHNGIVQLGVSGNGIFNNTYILMAVFAFIGSSIVYGVDQFFYKKYRREIEKEVVKTNRKYLYPIQVAQKIMGEWKKSVQGQAS